MISIVPYSQKALLIQWDGPIRRKTISEVNSFNLLIQSSGLESITETIPAFTSITVCYDGVGFSEIKSIVEHLYRKVENLDPNQTSTKWKLPILCLENLPSNILNATRNTTSEFYESFFDAKFTIGMKGFLPGFIYLAGLPESIDIPRKRTPDLTIPQGSVAIGGSQCGIYPKESPGGWHVIGNCPIPLIDLSDSHLSCFKIGDEIRFEAIDKAKHILYKTTDWNLALITSKFKVDE